WISFTSVFARSTCALVLFRTSCSVQSWCRDMSLVGFCKLYIFLWFFVQQEL
ncbi:hypothetical protein EV363DRAFT_1072482, partial [Boletus edulis]